MINPLWLVFLMLNTVFAVIGGAYMALQWNLKVLPFIIVVINFVFILYVYTQKSGRGAIKK